MRISYDKNPIERDFNIFDNYVATLKILSLENDVNRDHVDPGDDRACRRLSFMSARNCYR